MKERTSTFVGFGPEAFRWFEGLEAENSKAYFEAHRDVYEMHVRTPLHHLLDDLAPEFGVSHKIFRQNRDVRFSKNKAPYKTNTAGVIRREDRLAGGLYVSLAADGLTAGGGYYEFTKEQLKGFRGGILDDLAGARLESIVAELREAGLSVDGNALKTAPRGYPKDHPRIELLRLKHIKAVTHISPHEALDADAAREFVVSTWQRILPLMAWVEGQCGPGETSAGGH